MKKIITFILAAMLIISVGRSYVCIISGTESSLKERNEFKGNIVLYGLYLYTTPVNYGESDNDCGECNTQWYKRSSLEKRSFLATCAINLMIFIFFARQGNSTEEESA